MTSKIISFSAKYSDVKRFERAFDRYRRTAPIKDRLSKSKLFQEKLREVTNDLNIYVERATMQEVRD